MKESDIAQMEAEEIESSDNYFSARPEDDHIFKHRRFFKSGFDRGFKIAKALYETNYKD